MNALQMGFRAGRNVVVTETFGGITEEWLGVVVRADWSVVIVRKWGSDSRWPFSLSQVRLAA